jgi:hypothetical protein
MNLSDIFGSSKKQSKGSRKEPLPEPHEGLPDTDTPYGICPRCQKQSSFQLIGTLPATFDGGYIQEKYGQDTPTLIDRVASLVCRNCNQPVIVVEEEWVGDFRKVDGAGSGPVHYKGIFWWPVLGMSLSKDVPILIAGAYSESLQAFQANCFRASAVMARRTLEAISEDLGQRAGPLYQRIENLTKAGKLHSSLSEWAHEIRLIGNAGAHFDPITDVPKEDAEQILKFLAELVKFIYELPAGIKKKRTPPKG